MAGFKPVMCALPAHHALRFLSQDRNLGDECIDTYLTFVYLVNEIWDIKIPELLNFLFATSKNNVLLQVQLHTLIWGIAWSQARKVICYHKALCIWR